MTTEKDRFDLWWEWTTKGRLTDFQTITAEISDAVLMLTPEERMDRAIVTRPWKPGDAAARLCPTYGCSPSTAVTNAPLSA